MEDYFNEKIRNSAIWRYFTEELPKRKNGSIFNNITVPNGSREAQFIQILEEDWLELRGNDSEEAENKFPRVMNLLKETEIYRTVRTHYEDMQGRISQTNSRQAQQNRQGNMPNQSFDDKFSQVWCNTSGFHHIYIGGLNSDSQGSGLHGWQGLYALHKTGRIAINRILGIGVQNLCKVHFEREEQRIDKSILFGLPFEYEMLLFSLPLLFTDNDYNPQDHEMSLGGNLYKYRVRVAPFDEPSITTAYFFENPSHGPRTSSMSSA